MNTEMIKAREAVTAAQKRVAEIEDACQHKIVNDSPEWPEAGEGVCSECGYATGSWYCPDNAPSHRCEYSRSYDSCDHCGQPQERL